MPDRMYDAGTISVAANGTVVTGVGTLWTEVLVPLDTLECQGYRVSVLEVLDDTHIRIPPWPGGAKAGAGYLVRYDSPARYESAYVATQVRELVARARILNSSGPFYRAIDVVVNAPPATPAVNDTYVIGEAPTGSWAGYADSIAQWTGGQWSITPAEAGYLAYIENDEALWLYSDGAWAEIGASITSDALAAVAAALETVEATVESALSTVAAAEGVVTAARDEAEGFAAAAAAAATGTVRFDVAQSRTATEIARALGNLGVSNYAKTLLDDANAVTAQGTLGISAYAQTLLDDTSAVAARTTLGAQAALGYTPVNRAGDTAMSGNFTTSPGSFVAMNTAPVSGTISGGAFRSDTGNSQFAQFYCQHQTGVAIRAALLAVNISTVGSLVIDQSGNTQISGSLSKASGTFLIDHPLDPYNKDLLHGFVESPEYQNRYRGLVRLVDGRATVDIDAVAGMSSGTFAALNADAWVAGLQNQESFARLRPGPLVGATFEVICEDATSSDLVAWEVTARRNDTFVRSGSDPNTDSDGKFICEREKPE